MSAFPRVPWRTPTPWLALAGAAAGIVIASLPATQSALLLAGGVFVGLAAWQPALAVGGALVLGPTRAYLAATGRGGLAWDFGQLFFALAAAGWLARALLRRDLALPRLVVFIPLAAWLGAGALSLFNAAAWRDGVNELIKWAEVGVVIVIVHTEARRGKLGWVLAAILLSGAVQAGLGLWQANWRGAGPESFALPGGGYRAYGTFEQPNPFAGFLGLIWPVAAGLGLGAGAQALAAWREHGRPAAATGWAGLAADSGGLAGLILAGLYVSYSRGAWLGAAAAAAVMAMFWPRRLGLGVGLAAAGLALGAALLALGWVPEGIVARLANVTDFLNVTDVRGLNINDANFALVERLAHWQAAQAMAEAHPWLGVGLGNYVGAYPDYALIDWPFHLGHAHNIYLHTFAETGVVGLAAYGSLWGTVIILTVYALRRTDGWRRGVVLGLLGVWAHLLTHQVVDNLHVNNTDLMLAAQIGVLHAIIYRQRTTRD